MDKGYFKISYSKLGLIIFKVRVRVNSILKVRVRVIQNFFKVRVRINHKIRDRVIQFFFKVRVRVRANRKVRVKVKVNLETMFGKNFSENSTEKFSRHKKIYAKKFVKKRPSTIGFINKQRFKKKENGKKGPQFIAYTTYDTHEYHSTQVLKAASSIYTGLL